MNILTRESLNGTAPHLDIKGGDNELLDDQTNLNLSEEWNLTGDVGTDWIEPKYATGTEVRTRKNLEPGESFTSKNGFLAPKPMTEGNDERDLKSSFTGQEMFSLPSEDYPGTFPHTTIPYEDRLTAVDPEVGPTPSGWMRIQKAANEERRAIAAALPSPWSSPENMAVDISGFAGLGDDEIIFTTESDLESAEQATAEAYQQTLDENPEKKSDPTWLQQMWTLAVSAGTKWLTSRAASVTADAATAKTTTVTSFAASAAARVAPTPFYTKPLFIVGAAVAATALALAVAKKTKRG